MQKLILTNDALNMATAAEFGLLGEALKSNTTLLLLDLSSNKDFDDNMEYHSEITDCLVNSPGSRLRKLKMSSSSIDVKAHYLELID